MQGKVVRQRGGRVTNIDITELLKSYVDLLEVFKRNKD